MIKLRELWEIVQRGRLIGAGEMRVVVEVEGKKYGVTSHRVDEGKGREREIVLVVMDRRKLYERSEDREREIQEAIDEFVKYMTSEERVVADGWGTETVNVELLKDEAEVWVAKKKERERKERDDTKSVD